MIFFSVIIPVYNREELIKETINSALSQTFTNFEIIIVDDGSKDETGNVIQNEFSDIRIKYFYKKNEERGAARNYGLQNANGEYAVFFDSDDIMKPHYLEALKKTIDLKPEAGVYAAKYNFINDKGIETLSPIQPLKEGFYDFDFFLKGNVLACNYCLRIRDKVYKLFPPERELTTMEDWLFLLSNIEKKNVFLIDNVCLSMRQHEGRSMADNKKVISARKNAVNWALSNLVLNKDQQKKLKGWSHYFCGIHQYLENKHIAAAKETLTAINYIGLNRKLIILFFKGLIGRKIIKAFK